MNTLSVIMANYNHARYIGDALQAILDQSFSPTEVIVIDDGSTDDSVAVIEKLAQQHPIIQFFRNDRNHGAIFTANRALILAAGDYVYSAAADDRVLPGLFEKSMKLLAEYPQAGLCCSDPATFDDRTGIISENPIYWSDKPCYFSPDSLAEVISGWYIAGHTSLVKRSAMLEIGGFIPELNWHCDWFLWLAIGFRYGVCYIPEPLATFRRRADSYSALGERDPVQQPETLNRLLRLVKSPKYRDVLPRFIRSAVFAHFSHNIVRVLMSNPEHWDIETLLLTQFPLYQWNQELTTVRQLFQNSLVGTLDGILAKLVPWVIRVCEKDGIERVVIYGAGSHTRRLLPLWEEHKGPPVGAIIVTEPAGTREFMRLPVVRASEYSPLPGDGIVLSSYTFETQMAEYCRKNWPNLRYYTLYNP